MTRHVKLDAAYNERNRLVALLACLYPAGIRPTNIPGWDSEWHNCVYIDLPTGQVSFHYHERDGWLFEELPEYRTAWDGHSTEVKWQRIEGMMARALVEGGRT